MAWTDADLIVTSVVTEDNFWRVSELLNEVSVAAAGVDVLSCRDDVRVGDEAGCVMVITKRRVTAVAADWGRADDNLLRGLKQTRDKGERPLTAEEAEQLAALEPRFAAFVEQGRRVISGDSSAVSVVLCFLPYSLVMSVNPGLLSKRGRKAVEAQATLPICGKAEALALPATWAACSIVPLSVIVGIRKIGNLLITRQLHVHYTTGSFAGLRVAGVLGDEARAGAFEVDSTMFVTKAPATVHWALQVGSFICSVNGKACDNPAELRGLLSQAGGAIDVEVFPKEVLRCLTLTVPTGTSPALFKAMEEADSVFGKHPRDPSFLLPADKSE